MTGSKGRCLIVACTVAFCLIGCGSRPQPAPPSVPSGDATFQSAAHDFLEDYYRRNPTYATYLGIHTHDERIEDYSRQGVADDIASARRFRDRISAIDAGTLSGANQLDREQFLGALDSRLLTLETIRPWARDPDSYSSGITRTAYIMIKREFAPADVRLRHLIARERAMPAALNEARKNIDNPPRVYTEIAIEQIDGNRDFFATAVAAAFPGVTDQALLAEFKTANDAVVAAMAEYKKWLQEDVLKRSNGDFAFGEETYRKKLAADEMIDTPLDDLLAIAERDLKKNQAAFAETARLIDPGHSPSAVLKSLESDHPAPEKLLATTQSELDALARFMTEKHIVTIPKAASPRVEETPPFLRAISTASMDTPGPFETTATEAYYNMTLPDPKATPAEKREFMAQWYYALITNVSVHEVWPGHYLQFLYFHNLQSDVRKVFGASSNSEGWAHYCEQMMVDEGFRAGDHKFKLAQIQDALLRDARFIAGIRLHTRGMTIPQAEAFFVQEGYQSRPLAIKEAKRGTSDATYGYYTMGKLMILKLRDDYKAKMGAGYSLQKFHDTFISLGPLPLPLIRKAMLGEDGSTRSGSLFPQ